MRSFSVQATPIRNLIGDLLELEQLGNLNKLLDSTPSLLVFSVAKKQQNAGGDKGVQQEIPEDVIDCKIIKTAINRRILEVTDLIKQHYNLDLCNKSVVQTHGTD